MVAQALVFAMWAVTRIELFADHFTARWQRRDHAPFAAIADVRGKRYYLPFAVNTSAVCRTFCRSRQSREKLVCTRPFAETLKWSRRVSARKRSWRGGCRRARRGRGREFPSREGGSETSKKYLRSRVPPSSKVASEADAKRMRAQTALTWRGEGNHATLSRRPRQGGTGEGARACPCKWREAPGPKYGAGLGKSKPSRKAP